MDHLQPRHVIRSFWIVIDQKDRVTRQIDSRACDQRATENPVNEIALFTPLQEANIRQ